ncbi:helix-turn-helix domain-containing protein [Paracoccus siganidrum]|uniref:XRE family transcriptional regulator n=1 Tax=Paracoccus siganidrum TaxID=1276757 RepID=A0A419AAH4_9RHOB|nr:helix-turn-helix transcriptional regulator [Paracoccus siganidrum]RJL19940.1 XRE family transcriptional regulator [Paracoccus siganidrum]RMC35103.1 XRE family transcriptional regulator [Paracoccus siganidrum]
MNHPCPIGALLRDWRKRRGLSQMALSLDAGISQRHLSYVESGRARPSRDMVLRLAEELTLPLRERNAMLLAAGFAPAYPQRPFDAPGMEAARAAVTRILDGHLPHPALAVDRHWTLLAANEALALLLEGVPDRLLQPPVNVLRLSLRPEGLAPRILNFGEWRAHVLARLAHEAAASADPVLDALLEELRACPIPPGATAAPRGIDPAAIVVPLRIASPAGPLSFISTTTVFGTAVDVTLSEITIEAFFPADRDTAEIMAARMSDR